MSRITNTPPPQRQAPPPPEVAPAQLPPGVYVQVAPTPDVPAPASPTSPPPPVEQPQARPATREPDDRVPHPEINIYSHSRLLYWWPVWAVGYLMALLTTMNGTQVGIGGSAEWIHPNQNLGVIYTLLLLFVMLVTNVSVRGLASAIVLLSFLCVALVFAYFSWWDEILGWFGNLAIYMNRGFYLFFSTAVFLIWAFTVFVFDRLTYWRIRPGQITQVFLLGAGEKSYDTDNMTIEKFRDDIFRHWVLGLGTGDLHIHTFVPRQTDLHIPNVVFVGHKVSLIQRMIAVEPDAFGTPSVM